MSSITFGSFAKTEPPLRHIAATHPRIVVAPSYRRLVFAWFYVAILLLNDVANAQLLNYRPDASYSISGSDRSSQSQQNEDAKVVDLTRSIVSGYDGARVDYDDVSGVIDRLTLNVTSATHAILPPKRFLKGRNGESPSSLCGLPATVFFASDTLEMSDIKAFEKAAGQQIPTRGAVIVIFPAVGNGNTPPAPGNNLKMQPTPRSATPSPASQSLSYSSSLTAASSSSSQAASLAATGVGQTVTLMRSKDVVSRDVAKYLTMDRNISVLATNAHYLDHVGKHSNTLERLLLNHQVIIIRNIATPGISASRWMENIHAYGNNLNAHVFIYEPVFPSTSVSPVRSTQQKALNTQQTLVAQPVSSAIFPHGGRLALAGMILNGPRRKLACLSLSNLNARALDSRTYRPIQTGFSTELEVSLQLRSPGHTYLSTPSSHQFLTASIPDELKFGTCAKMPILVTRGVSSVVSVANLIAWENERRKGSGGRPGENGGWIVNDQMILFQVISIGEEPPGGDSMTKLFIEPEVFTWLRRSRNVRAFGFDHQLDAVLGNKHEIESVLGQLDDTVTIYNVFNLANIRTSRTFTYSGIRSKRNANVSRTTVTTPTGCNQFQCAFISLRLWPASLAPVQLFAVSEVGSTTQQSSHQRGGDGSGNSPSRSSSGNSGHRAAVTSSASANNLPQWPSLVILGALLAMAMALSSPSSTSLSLPPSLQPHRPRPFALLLLLLLITVVVPFLLGFVVSPMILFLFLFSAVFFLSSSSSKSSLQMGAGESCSS